MAYKTGVDNHLTHLFFAYNEVVDIDHENSDVLLLDCTYRTNRFNLPLLHIVGLSRMNITIHVAQVFMSGETGEDFAWTLQELKELITRHGVATLLVIFCDCDLALLKALEYAFPAVSVLMCAWHITKDVETHARRHGLPRELDQEASTPRKPKWRESAEHRQFCDAFDRLVRSNTVKDYEFRRPELHALCSKEAAYVDDGWLDIWLTRMVQCCTSRVTHFGVQSTSRVEGYHSALKR